MCVIAVGAFVVTTAASEVDDLATRDAFLVAMLVITALAGVVVTISSRRVARRAVQPLSRLSERMSAIHPGSGERVALTSGITEIDHLAARFDDLIGRFDDALARERRLTAQASHEVRTPLTPTRCSSSRSRLAPGLQREVRAQAIEHRRQYIDAFFANLNCGLD